MSIRELDPTDVIILKHNEKVRWSVPVHVRGTRDLSGGEAEVVAVVDSDGMRVAKKTYFVVPRTPKGEPTINIEIRIYAALRAVPYTLDFLGCVQRNLKKGPTLDTYLSPWCDNSLQDLVGTSADPATRVQWFTDLSGEEQWKRICVILLQLSRALFLFHSLKEPLIHHDIKPSNLLFHPETHAIIFIDFGVSRICSDGTTGFAPGGTRTYSSPEFLEDAVTNRKSDVYSLGCVVVELLAKASGKDVSKFRKYRKEDRILVNGRWQRNPAIKSVRFEDPATLRDDSFARHPETVAAYVDSMREPGVFKKLCDIAMLCLSADPRIRPSASSLHTELRNAILHEIDEDAQTEFPALPISPASSKNALVVGVESPDSSEDEGMDLRKYMKQVSL
ncbi:hypothetical protein HDU87_001485 [Geranomyces variabilis]|uniref:non-specific serine/threonine protein kinase n=1 Tax=Geranomyces variabilis TaxID=109894 RepID=A0AAD5TDF4_9FUNG|nr:hypothetical protein HDU87_001485 [Geranomyces variabilis]